MNADKATDETDGVWLYSAVMSLMNRLIILVMMFHLRFFVDNDKQSISACIQLLENKLPFYFFALRAGYMYLCTFSSPSVSHCDLLRSF